MKAQDIKETISPNLSWSGMERVASFSSITEKLRIILSLRTASGFLTRNELRLIELEGYNLYPWIARSSDVSEKITSGWCGPN